MVFQLSDGEIRDGESVIFGEDNINRFDLFKSLEIQWRDIFCVVDANKQYVTMHKYEVVKYNLLVLSDLVAQ